MSDQSDPTHAADHAASAHDHMPTAIHDAHDDEHDHAHDDEHDHAHDDEHDHAHDDEHDHAHGDHDHAGGLVGLLGEIFHTHSHSGPRADAALESSDRGIQALKISLAGLFLTALFQVVIAALSGSAGLLADTIHNFADALTAVPLWIAFVVGRRPPTRRYTYGYRRAEDLAGIFIIVLMLASAAFAAWESYRKLVSPEPIKYLPWVMVAAVVGFVGNELVAILRIRVGREIGSAALEADGQHARVDGLTSLAVLAGAIGVALGFPLADPIIGLLITIPILLVVRDAAKTIWERLMDAVDPSLVDAIERKARDVAGVREIHDVRLRWLGHILEAELHIGVDSAISTAASHAIAQDAEHTLLHTLPQLRAVAVHVDPVSAAGEDFHAATAHHKAKS
jgi:cation diffusion facilitator family transporter